MRLLMVVVVLALLGCTGRAQALDIPPVADDNIYTRAIAKVPVDDQFVMVSEKDFHKALDGIKKPESDDLAALKTAFAAGGLANDPWTTGVVGASIVEKKPVTSSLWVVVGDAAAYKGRLILGTQFRVVALKLNVNATWYATALSFTQEMASVGTGRCCGPLSLCDTGGTFPSPCPKGMCGDTTLVKDSGAGDPRTAAGYLPREVTFYTEGLPVPTTCQPHLIPGCSNTNEMCGLEIGFNPFQTIEADVPTGSGMCGGGTRPVQGRNPPPQCLYADFWHPGPSPGTLPPPGSMVASGGGRLPECEGRCIRCEADNQWTDANLRVRQCALYKPAPGSGLPGDTDSGVCQSTSGSVLVEQGAIRSAAGISPGASGHHCDPANSQGVRICTGCDATTCLRTVERTPSPIAADQPSANTASADCDATNSSGCSATGAPGGSTGGTANPDTGGIATREQEAAGTGTQTDNGAPPASPNTPPPTPPPNGSGEATDTEPKPDKPARNQAGAEGGDPILLSDGSFELRHTDLSFPGPARPLEFIRSYNSRSRGRSELGSNWTHNWDVRLIPLNDSNRPSWADPYCAGSPFETTCIMLYVGDSPRLFTRDITTGVFVPQAGVLATLVPLANDTGWTLESADGHNLQFDADGYMKRDVDRFGNGFEVTWDYNAAGLVFSSVCPRDIERLSGSSGTYVVQMGAVYSADSFPCTVLGGMVGQRKPIQYSPSSIATLTIQLPAGTPAGGTLEQARNLIVSLQSASGRKVGSGIPWGNRLKRVAKVAEIRTTGTRADGSFGPTGYSRELNFEYWPDNDATAMSGASAGLTRAGMLKAVSGPAGGRVEFTYTSADTAAGHPAWLNEVFLTQVTRNDGAPGITGLSATPLRSTVFGYAWTTNAVNTAELATAEKRYQDFLLAQVGCTYYTLDHCGQHAQPGFTYYDIDADVANYSANLRSDVADNIIRVDNQGILESETRYDNSVFSLNFDKATRQRWGSTDVEPTPIAGDFTSTLPEEHFEYAEASPVAEGADDTTTAFLEAAISQRYPLEALPAGQADWARSKGMLLAPSTPSTVAIAGRLPPIAEGFFVPSSTLVPPACSEQALPYYRSALAGYRPSFDYFDTPLPAAPAHPDYDTVTEGVNLDMQLTRSRLSCDTLALAQTWDARHNDLEWTWSKVNGLMQTKRVTGRRQYMNANANRICAWTRETDRDGHVHVYGLNYHGRQLVDAVNVENTWRFAETLYNADGNVLSSRRTMAQDHAWTASSGDTRYQYMEILPTGTSGLSCGASPANCEPLPWAWARRGNVLSIVDRPRGGTLPDVNESTLAADATKGRYSQFEYEPLFNQVRRVKAGVFESTLAMRETLRTTVIFDYQEGDVALIQPILDRQQHLGFQYNLTSGTLSAATALNWPMAFGLGDVNGDTYLATTLFGLPMEVRVEAGGMKESTFYGWNRGGRLTFQREPDGSQLNLEYLSLGTYTGTPAANETGFLGRLVHLPSRSWSNAQGPARAPCPNLAGPYQWLLPSNCNAAGLASQLETQLMIPTEASQAITSQQSAANDGVTQYEYSLIGQLSKVTSPDNKVQEYDRDVDGRVTTERLYDAATLHFRTDITYDTQLRPTTVRRYDANNQDLGALVRNYDEEGRVLFECREFVTNGCTINSRGTLPPDGESRTLWYSGEGYLLKEADAEGATADYARDARKWVTRVVRAAPNETSRSDETTYDDDGNATSLRYGVVNGMPTLTEAHSFDGAGRLASVTDTQGRKFTAKYSPRDVLVSLGVSNPGWGAGIFWTNNYDYDAFMRAYRETTNGTVTREVSRRAGGQVWASFDYGKRTVFTTYDADGFPVWEEDSGQEIVTLHSGRPDSRVVTESTIRKSGTAVHTTSSVRTFDVLGNEASVTETGASTSQARLSRSKTFQRNASGFVTLETDALGATVENIYDYVGRLREKRELRAIGQPDIDTTKFGYDRRGALKLIKDAKGESTTYQYSGYGEPTRRDSPGTPAVVATWSYDWMGRPFTETLGPSSLTYQYNSLGQLYQVLSGHVAARSYTYDSLGRLFTATNYNLGLGFGGSPVAIANRSVTTGLAYDSLGRITAETNTISGSAARTVSSTYSTTWMPTAPMGVNRSVLRPDKSTSREDGDTLGRFATLNRRPAGLHARDTEWLFLGDFTTERRDTNIGTRLDTVPTRDALGQVLRLNTAAGSSKVVDINMLRDALGRIGSYSCNTWRPTLTKPDATWRGYAYDGMGRITTLHEAATIPSLGGAQTHTLTAAQVASMAKSVGAATWAYTREAAVGSLVSITKPGATRFSAPARGPGHELTSYSIAGGPSATVAHDAAGRMTTDGTRAYGWDAFSSLVSVKTSGALTEALQYDGLGRLVARWNTSGLVDQYAWDGQQIVAALTATKAPTPRWSAFWGPGIDNLVSVATPTNEYLALTDGRGSVGAWYSAASTGKLAADADYTPEGRTTWRTFSTTGAVKAKCDETTNSGTCAPALGLPFGFHSALKSSATGLLYFRNRWYSTLAGQWLSQDPLGPVDSQNLYAFNRFDSVNFRDPRGFKSGGMAVEGHFEDCESSGLCHTFVGEEIVVTGLPPEEPYQPPCISSMCVDKTGGRELGVRLGDGLDPIPVVPPSQPNSPGLAPQVSVRPVGPNAGSIRTPPPLNCTFCLAWVNFFGQELIRGIKGGRAERERMLRDALQRGGSSRVEAEIESNRILDAYGAVGETVGALGAGAVAGYFGKVPELARPNKGPKRLPAGRTGRAPGPTVDPRTGQPVGQFIVDPKGNTLIQPAGGTTKGNALGTFVETRFPNRSPAQQLHGPHRNYPESHGHGFKPGPGVNERGPSLDPLGNEVPYDSRAAHWPVNP